MGTRSCSRCCVEGCTNHVYQKDRDVSISFHTVPAKTDLRDSWLRILNKFNPSFVPNDSSSVCSLHFTPANYKPHSKRRLLLPDAVPSIFPRYPQPVENLCTQSTTAKNKNSPRKRKGSAPITDIVTPIIVESFPKHEWDSSDEVDAISYGNVRSIGVQVSLLPTGRLQALKKENSILRSQNFRLKEHLKALTEKAYSSKLKFESNTEYHRVMIIKDNLQMNHNVKAQFLIDQINNFDKHQPHWSDSTLQECLNWRSEASKSYDYARNNELISLPSRCTLERYVKCKNQPATYNQETEQIVHTIIINEPPCGNIYSQPVSTKLVKNTPKLYASRNLKIPSYETVSKGLLHAFVIQNIPQENSLDGAQNVTNPVNLIDIDTNISVMNNSPLEFISVSDNTLETINADNITHIEITSSVFTNQV